MKNVDLKVLALGTVGIVLILLTLGGLIRAVRTGEGLDPGTASAAFALLGAMVAGSLGATAAAIDKKKKEEDEEEDYTNYEDPL
jgi:hypothetical protein